MIAGHAVEIIPCNKNMGPVTWNTSCKFERDLAHGTVKITQTSFIDKIIEWVKVFCTSPSLATADCNLKPWVEDEEGREWQVRPAVRFSMWLLYEDEVRQVVYRPGHCAISHGVSKRHWDSIERILKYLKYVKYTRTKGVTLDRKKELALTLFADSDFALNENDRYYVTCAAVMCAWITIS